MDAAVRPARLLRTTVRAQGDGAAAPGPLPAQPRKGGAAPKPRAAPPAAAPKPRAAAPAAAPKPLAAPAAAAAKPRAAPAVAAPKLRAAPPAAKPQHASEVAVFWDLDNKGPEPIAPPRPLAAAVLQLGARYGTPSVFDAFANRHAFTWTPSWLAASARADVEAEARASGLVCELCGRRCKSVEHLQKHFAELHLREAAKQRRGWAGRRKQPDAKARAKAARVRAAEQALFVPRKGNHVGRALRDEGVRVVRVPDTPQAADEALKSALHKFLAQHAQPGAIDAAAGAAQQPPPTVLLLSDDRGFDGTLLAAAKRGARCVLVSSAPRDLPGVEHVPWEHVLDLAAMLRADEEEDFDGDEDYDDGDDDALWDFLMQ